MSFEELPLKRPNTYTRQQAKVMKKLNNYLEKRDDKIPAIKKVFEDSIGSGDVDLTEI